MAPKRQKNEIGVHSTRGGAVFGEHKIRFLGEFEEISFVHKAYSRELFASGAFVLADWLCKQEKGVYELKDAF